MKQESYRRVVSIPREIQDGITQEFRLVITASRSTPYTKACITGFLNCFEIMPHGAKSIPFRGISFQINMKRYSQKRVDSILSLIPEQTLLAEYIKQYEEATSHSPDVTFICASDTLKGIINNIKNDSKAILLK